MLLIWVQMSLSFCQPRLTAPGFPHHYTHRVSVRCHGDAILSNMSTVPQSRDLRDAQCLFNGFWALVIMDLSARIWVDCN